MKHINKTPQDFLRTIQGVECLMADLAEICKGNDVVVFLCYSIHSLRRANRLYGRRTGDALLAAVSKWTLSFPGGTLYRIEGDKFCIMFRNIDAESVHQLAVRMESRFGRPWKLSEGGRSHDVLVQASIAMLEDLECDYSGELPELLDQALETAEKEQRIIRFTAEHDRLTREKSRLKMELKNCILSDMKGFYLEFQPLVDPAVGTWRGLEALCRWTGPEAGPTPPDIFIREVEKMGLIHLLGGWVINRAIEACRSLRLDEIDRFFVAVNISALQLNRHDYVSAVSDVLEKQRFPANRLMLEVNENPRFLSGEHTKETIRALRAKGVMIALGGFGSGYSGFSGLKSLPVDFLKIDWGSADDAVNDAYLQYFYYIMSETAHASNMRLIAEGVETQGQLHSIMRNGADLIQGFLFSRPMSIEDVDRSRDSFITPQQMFSGWVKGMLDLRECMNSESVYKTTPTLFDLQSRCIDFALDEEDVETSLHKVLEAVGKHFSLFRAYVFMSDGNAIFSEKYEWCAEGAASQMHLFQNVDASADGFYQALQRNGVVMVTREMRLPKNLRKRLADAGRDGAVQSILAMPMKRRGEIIGFVGFDDPAERIWLPEELLFLHNLCLLCQSVLARSNECLIN